MKQIMQTRIADAALEIRSAAMLGRATTFGSAASGPDGGFAIPAELAREILMPTTGGLLPYCRQIPVTQGGSIGLPLDTDTGLAATPGGIVAAWESEGADLPERKPLLDLTMFNLKKLVALVPVTDELLEDSAALAEWLPLALQTAVTRKVNDAILAGLGVGTPLGILNSGSRIEVAKEAAQAAGSVVEDNLSAMLARSLNPMGSAWVVNPSIYSEVICFSHFDSATQRLAGLPIITTESCSALGSAGDIVLADLSAYLVALKNPQLHSSMHVWFDQGIQAYRLTFRMDGQPLLKAPIQPQNSAVTKSHFVTLAERT